MMSTSHRTTSPRERNSNSVLLRHVPLSPISLVLGARLIRISDSSVCLWAELRTTAAVGYINAAACRTSDVGGGNRAGRHPGTGTRRKRHMEITIRGLRRQLRGGAAASHRRDGEHPRRLPFEGATARSRSDTKCREGGTKRKCRTGQKRGMWEEDKAADTATARDMDKGRPARVDTHHSRAGACLSAAAAGRRVM